MQAVEAVRVDGLCALAGCDWSSIWDHCPAQHKDALDVLRTAATGAESAGYEP
jgi:hypothetical protein